MLRTAIILKSPHAPVNGFYCAIRIRLADLNTTCLLCDEDADSIPELLQRQQARRDPLHKSPLYLISIFAEELGYRAERWREKLDRSIVKLETAIAMTGFHPDPLLDATAHYRELIRDLQTANMSLIWLDGIIISNSSLAALGSK